MENILITGGLGYIGGRVATYLKAKMPGVNICLTTRTIPEKIPSWAKQFTLLSMDLLDETSIAACFKKNKFDVIIHLAALNEIESMKDPHLALQVNVMGTYTLLHHARLNHTGKFIYFSTFHVYGNIEFSVITEDTPTRPFHPYAFTHRASEDMVTFFQYYHQMKTIIFRLSNGYGSPMHKEVNRWTLVFNDLCRQAVTTGKIQLKSSGRQTRDFISLYNVARAVHHFLSVIPEHWGDGLYNLGGNCNMSILDVANTVSETYKQLYRKEISEINTVNNEQEKREIKPFQYSIAKLLRTGFQLKDNLQKEITDTLHICEDFKDE